MAQNHLAFHLRKENNNLATHMNKHVRLPKASSRATTMNLQKGVDAQQTGVTIYNTLARSIPLRTTLLLHGTEY